MNNLLLLIAVLNFSTLANQNGILTINITGISPKKGNIEIGIYNKSEDFPRLKKEFKRIILPVNSSNISHTVNDIPEGYYAIALFHDENKDGKCNRNLIGIPVEGYGFSNNVLPRLKAPSFQKTRFMVEKNTSVTIKLVY